jgi:GNAT superfamily N-acetyltransferase
VKRDLGDAYELDDDPARVDHDAVFAFLSEEAYWARGRAREVVDATIDDAARVVGLYHDDRQVGFVRIVSDRHTVAYVADVYVLEEHRGHGLGLAMMTFALDEGPLAGIRKVGLHTSNAHALYRRLGFSEPDGRYMERWNLPTPSDGPSSTDRG